MPLVYRAANVIDAQMVVDELKAGGMDAHITGEFLSGAVGELPPDGLVGVWLTEAMHVTRARQLIDEFEASRRLTGADRACPSCGEMLGVQFGRCWQCGALQPEVS